MILLLGGEHNGIRVAHWLPQSTDSETVTCGAFQAARCLRCARKVKESPYHYTRSRIKIWVLGPPISWLDELANEPKPSRV